MLLCKIEDKGENYGAAMNVKKVFQTIQNTVAWMIVVLGICMMMIFLLFIQLIDHADRSLFGYSLFIAHAEFMGKTGFKAGDLVLLKQVDPATLQVGDIISYQSTAQENAGVVVTHRIRERITNADGHFSFITYEATTDINNASVVPCNLVLGKYHTKLPGRGKWFLFLKNIWGFLACIDLFFLLLILDLFVRWKGKRFAKMEAAWEKEQAKMAEERRRLEAERRESQIILSVLLKLRTDSAQQQEKESCTNIDP